MKMLRVYEYNDRKSPLAELEKATAVKVSRELNGAYTLEFLYPDDEKSKEIRLNRYVECEGQFFRIVKTETTLNSGEQTSVYCEHVYMYDAAKIHLQNVPDFIGQSPTAVLSYAFSGTAFTLMSDDELAEKGLKRVDSDGFLIDFFSMDKTTPFEVMETVIENCGKGEIYIDNYKVALVERIGSNTTVELNTSVNMQDITVERDISEMITRLYPYGYDDLHIGTVNGGTQYIDSPNTAVYGVREGFKDYSDYKTPDEVLSRGLWEFSADNEERIDIPVVNISGTFCDLSKISGNESFYKVDLGDEITVVDRGVRIRERIKSIVKYPYEPEQGSCTIGRIKKDLFFYMNQMGKLTRGYKKNTTTGGKVTAKSISGPVVTDGVKVPSSSGNVTVMTDRISMSDSSGLRFICGVSGNVFTFAVYDKNGRALYIADDVMNVRGNVSADTFAIKGAAFTTDTSGNVYINGKKIQTESEG